MPTSKTKELAKKLGLVKKRRAESGLYKSSKRRKGQLLSYVIVIDFESTCWKDKKGAQEIIEFPAVLLDLQMGDVVDEFQQYVQPRENPILSNFCKELTGISQTQVDNGVPLSTCLYLFGKWVRGLREEKGVCLMEPGRQYSSHDVNLCALATWSDWDLGVCLQYECRRKQIRKPVYFDQWIDLRIVYKQFYDCKPSGLCGSLKDLGIPFTGREHCGLDDARNTATLCYRLVKDGCRLNITKSIWKKRPITVVRAPPCDTAANEKENDTKQNKTSLQHQIIPPKPMGTHSGISESNQGVKQEVEVNTTSKVEEGAHTRPADDHNYDTAEQREEEEWNESFLNGIIQEMEEVENNYSDMATHQDPHSCSRPHMPANPTSSVKTRDTAADNTPSRLGFFSHITPVTLLPSAQDKPDIGLKTEQQQQQQPTTVLTLPTSTVPIHTCRYHDVTEDNSGATANVSSRMAPSCISFRTPSTTQWIKAKSSHSLSPSILSSPQPFNGGKITPPLCNCGKRAKRKLVTSPGPNQGKPFFSCPGGRETGCQYFRWETSSPHGVNHSSTVNLSSEYD